jgi:hypothetical protein
LAEVDLFHYVFTEAFVYFPLDEVALGGELGGPYRVAGFHE